MSDIRLIKFDRDGGQARLAGYSAEGQAFTMGRGMVPLAQALISNLLTEPGSDRLSPTRGGGLLSLLKRRRVADAELTDEIRRRVRSVERFMLAEQSGKTLANEDRLRSLQLRGVSQGATPEEIELALFVKTDAGSAFLIALAP